MYQNFVVEDINAALPLLCRTLLRRGEENGSRNGTVKELTHVGITLTNPLQREILLEGRKANIAAQIAETMWVLTGRSDMDFLTKYLPRAADYSDDGVVWRGAYGPRLRAWPGSLGDEPLDQWQHCLDLLKKDPLTRRAVMTIYDPTEDTPDGLDIPCNNWITFSSRLGRLDMHVGIRSNDLLWGWSGINAFEWSAMLEISAGLLGIQPGSLHFSTTSLHLYAPHWEKAEGLAALDGWAPLMERQTPRFSHVSGQTLTNWDAMADDWFMIERKIREGHKASGVNYLVDRFPDPMMQSWLRVLQWWWTGDHAYLKPLAGTPLEYATHVAMQPPPRKPSTMEEAVLLATQFIKDGKADHVRRTLRGLGAIRVANLGPEQAQKFIATLTGDDVAQAMASSQEAAEGTLAAFVGGGISAQEAGENARAMVAATSDDPSHFIRFAVATHIEKHEAYGDSWKRRGEMLGIMANIARKVDRLGGAETSDETSADTAMDLMVYLAKYATWLEDQDDFLGELSDTPLAANDLLFAVDRQPYIGVVMPSQNEQEQWLRDKFDDLERAVTGGHARTAMVGDMLRRAYVLARYLWETRTGEPTPERRDEYRGADVD
jgi:thymidylate synthase